MGDDVQQGAQGFSCPCGMQWRRGSLKKFLLESEVHVQQWRGCGSSGEMSSALWPSPIVTKRMSTIDSLTCCHDSHEASLNAFASTEMQTLSVLPQLACFTRADEQSSNHLLSGRLRPLECMQHARASQATSAVEGMSSESRPMLRMQSAAGHMRRQCRLPRTPSRGRDADRTAKRV